MAEAGAHVSRRELMLRYPMLDVLQRRGTLPSLPNHVVRVTMTFLSACSAAAGRGCGRSAR